MIEWNWVEMKGMLDLLFARMLSNKDDLGDIIINLITNIMNVCRICYSVYHPHIIMERNLDERKASYVHRVLSYYQMHTFE